MIPLAFIQDQLANAQEFYESLEEMARLVCEQHADAEYEDVLDYIQRHAEGARCEPLYNFPEDRP
jgi:hypothetical protein